MSDTGSDSPPLFRPCHLLSYYWTLSCLFSQYFRRISGPVLISPLNSNGFPLPLDIFKQGHWRYICAIMVSLPYHFLRFPLHTLFCWSKWAFFSLHYIQDKEITEQRPINREGQSSEKYTSMSTVKCLGFIFHFVVQVIACCLPVFFFFIVRPWLSILLNFVLWWEIIICERIT